MRHLFITLTNEHGLNVRVNMAAVAFYVDEGDGFTSLYWHLPATKDDDDEYIAVRESPEQIDALISQALL